MPEKKNNGKGDFFSALWRNGFWNRKVDRLVKVGNFLGKVLKKMAGG